MSVGSLCTGYGGLDLAIGGELVFVSEIDRDANRVLAQRFPTVPNLGDFTQVDELPDVDVLTAGFPCQPVSQVGRRQGTDDERWLWDDIEAAVGRMGRPPRILFLENVRGLLTANGGDAMARVVHGLARLGYVGSYRLVRASDVGAPHRRERVFIHARHTDSVAGTQGLTVDRRPGEVAQPGPFERTVGSGGGAAAHTEVAGLERRGSVSVDRPETTAEQRATGRSRLFGPYWPAVHRWERIFGRPAPDPTTTDTDSPRRREVTGSVRSDAEGTAGRTPLDDHEPVSSGEERDGPEPSRRLNPRFVEWMMGLPDGWVTDCALTRTAQLRILGNGVVPQQAAHAWRSLVASMPPT